MAWAIPAEWINVIDNTHGPRMRLIGEARIADHYLFTAVVNSGTGRREQHSSR